MHLACLLAVMQTHDDDEKIAGKIKGQVSDEPTERCPLCSLVTG